MEETEAIVRGQVDAFLNKKKNASPPLKNKLDPELVKRTVDNLMRAPVPLDDNNVRILKKTVIAKRNTRATAAAAKKRVTQKGKKSVPQLGEQAKQSLAPLKVFSDDDIVDENGIVRGTNIEDYLPDNVQFESLEEVGTYRYGHSLVNPGTPLTTMMQRLHTWYLDCCKSGGPDSIFVVVK